jgi:disulfide bond formation protein DsbB
MKALKTAIAGLVGAGLALAILVAVPAVASANTTCYTSAAPGSAPKTPGDCTTPTQPPAVVQAQASQPPAVVATPHASTPSSLPFTGADVVGLLAMATIALAAGTVLVLASRRRRLSL